MAFMPITLKKNVHRVHPRTSMIQWSAPSIANEMPPARRMYVGLQMDLMQRQPVRHAKPAPTSAAPAQIYELLDGRQVGTVFAAE